MKRHQNPFSAYASFPRNDGLGDYNGKEWGVDVTAEQQEVALVPTLAGPRQRRIRFFLFFLLGLTSIYVFRLFSLQFSYGAVYRERAETNRTRLLPTVAPRGVLFDRTGQPLVRNVANQVLLATPADLKNDDVVETVSQKIAVILGEDHGAVRDELLAARASTYTSVVLREQLDREDALQLRLHEDELQGLSIEERPRREYIAGPAFSHLLGYVGKITQEEFDARQRDGYLKSSEVGKTGVEASFERLLRGKNGAREVEIDATGKTQRIIATSDPEAGENLLLTADRALQERASASLEAMMERSGGTGGAAVVVNVHNGEVLAFVSAPTFDNNMFVTKGRNDEYATLLKDERKPLFSRALSGTYPPGSTIKPLLAAIALDEGVVGPETVIHSTGGIKIQSWFFPDWKAGGHGATTVTKAIAESVNTFFYMIGGGTDVFRGLGITKMTKLLRQFGLGQLSGIQLDHEAGGFLPTPQWKEKIKNETWYIGDTYHAAIGQGDLLVTPLQMAFATAAIANNGTLFEPKLIAGTMNDDGTIKPTKPMVREAHVASEQSLRVVREGMRRAVTDGSSRALADAAVPAAGKTGTAQFGNANKTHAWFTAFAPYENPEIALAVVVEGGGEGHAAALPVAEDILNAYFH